MRVFSKPEDEKSRLLLKSIYRQLPAAAGLDSIRVEFGESNGVFLFENSSVLQINTGDAVFQDESVITPFICQELERIAARKLGLPKFLEDVVCGRRAAGLYQQAYFQLCYLQLLKIRKIGTLQEFLDANSYWIIFSPLDSYNSDFLRKITAGIKHEKRLAVLCQPLFKAAKSSLSSSEKLNSALQKYQELMSNAGN